MKLKYFPPKTIEVTLGRVVMVHEASKKEIERFAIDALKQVDSDKIKRNDFAFKIATAMKKISSSHVYFIIQQAYGEISWEEVEKILAETIQSNKP